MIVYFANRFMDILGHASTKLPNGFTIKEDLKSESVERGVSVFECKIPFDKNTRAQVQACTEVGNYILRSHENENEFYTIIDTEIDTKNQEVFLYAEDAGMDLLNEIVGPYEADTAQPIRFYIEKFAYDSGFEIGINEAEGLANKLSWDGEATVTERIASVATQFGNYEVSYSFDVKGLTVTRKYINIYKKRGTDTGVQLRLNKEIDRIVTKKTVANLATALECTGGTPENEETPITLLGYSFDDGDFYVSGSRLLSRTALKKWSRYVWTKEPQQITGQEGHIVRPYSYDTLSKSTLCAHAVTKLKELREIEVNYEVDISLLPDNVKIGDRINIIDDAGELYLSTRILLLETSVAEQTHTATLGEYLLKNSGISEKVIELATQFSENSLEAKRAKAIAEAAKKKSEEAKNQAETAVTEAENAKTVADNAQASANIAQESSQLAKESADNAQSAVGAVVESVEQMEEAVSSAKTAADNATQAAEIATEKAEIAKESAQQASEQADNAQASSDKAVSSANSAVANSKTAQESADIAKISAQGAQATAKAAKLDAQQAIRDVDNLGEQLDTVSSIMQTNYARKTELTETEATLQSQIDRNAAQISSTVSKVLTVDETANNAQEQATQAQQAAADAQEKADVAQAEAKTAQAFATEAQASATKAQANADTARIASEVAQEVSEKAKLDLFIAERNLTEVLNNVDATEEEIRIAQEAVATAQITVNQAKTDFETALALANNAQTVANSAVQNAFDAQLSATEAKKESDLATELAEKSASHALTEQGKAEAEQSIATEAKAKAEESNTIAQEAQGIANTAKELADTAKLTADNATKTATEAQNKAENAEERVVQAGADLEDAQTRYQEVLADAYATEEEIAEAKNAVDTATTRAEEAQAYALIAQGEATEAQRLADIAQTEASTAKLAADNAQKEASEAQKMADSAQAEVDGLAVRMIKAESGITQNAENIQLSVQKIETSNSELRDTINEQSTSLTQSCEQIILRALSSYTETGDFESFQKVMESQLSLLSNQMTLKFTETHKQLEGINESLQGQLNTITKYFSFSIDGLTIGEVNSPNKVVIDNDEIVIEVNGNAVQRFDASGKSLIPELKVIKTLDLFGYVITQDAIGNVNCEWIGGK